MGLKTKGLVERRWRRRELRDMKCEDKREKKR